MLDADDFDRDQVKPKNHEERFRHDSEEVNGADERKFYFPLCPVVTGKQQCFPRQRGRHDTRGQVL
jgi:hypothetical protein